MRLLSLFLLLFLVACDTITAPAPPAVYVELKSTFIHAGADSHCVITWEVFSSPPITADPSAVVRYVLMVNGSPFAVGSFMEGEGTFKTFKRLMGSYQLRWRFDSINYVNEDGITGYC